MNSRFILLMIGLIALSSSLVANEPTTDEPTTDEPKAEIENWVLDNCFDRDGIYDGYNNSTCEKYIDPSIYE